MSISALTDRILMVGAQSNAPGPLSSAVSDLLAQIRLGVTNVPAYNVGRQGIIGVLRGANFNITTDNIIPLVTTSARIDRVLVTNASVSLTTAQGGVYTAASKGGTAIVASSQAYTALTAAGKYVELTLVGGTADTNLYGTQLFLNLTTGQGAPATADVYVIGIDLAT